MIESFFYYGDLQLIPGLDRPPPLEVPYLLTNGGQQLRHASGRCPAYHLSVTLMDTHTLNGHMFQGLAPGGNTHFPYPHSFASRRCSRVTLSRPIDLRDLITPPLEIAFYGEQGVQFEPNSPVTYIVLK